MPSPDVSPAPLTSPDRPAPATRWTEAPVLAGARVLVRGLRPEDAAGYRAAAVADDGVADVFRWLALPPAITDELAAEQITAALGAAGRSERVPFAMLDRETGEFIGTTSYYDIVPGLRTLAIGHTWFGRPWWRTGHNRDSKLLLLTHAFESLGAVRVVWHTDIYNERSQAAIAGLGAQREGVLRKHRIRRDGSWRDTVQFAMTDDDWPTAKARLMAPRAG